MNALDLETPAPYIDLDILERNLRRMQERCRGWKVGLRPHTKTHKIPEIARMQLAGGAIGITVAKTGEAEVMPGDDVLIAYPILPDKMPRVRELAKKRRVTVTVDSVDAARALQGVGALVEVDIGFHRCGVQSAAHYEEVARACPEFRGLFYYPAGLDQKTLYAATEIIREHAALRKCEIVSGGSTPNAEATPRFPETTEIRCGTYALNDASVLGLGLVTPADCAFRMLVSVVSTAVPGQCIVDGGAKTFSFNPTKIVGGYGGFVDRPWRIDKLSEEHGWVKVSGPAPRVGEKLWVIPGHAGTCMNLHDEIAYGRGGRVEGTWPIAARGKIR